MGEISDAYAGYANAITFARIIASNLRGRSGRGASSKLRV